MILSRLTKRGLTLPEVLIAGSLSTLVSIVVMTTFIWTGRQSVLCSKIAWSQREVMKTNGKIEQFIRNASAISAIDEVHGNWVEVRFPDNSTGRFTYYNEPGTPRDGRLFLLRNGSSERIVARGLTKITNTGGYPMPMFTRINDRTLRISYRVSEPTASGSRASDDELFAAFACFAVNLRNVAE
jgi:hypothetical protein